MVRIKKQCFFCLLAFLALLLAFPGKGQVLAEGNGAKPTEGNGAKPAGPAKGSLTLDIAGEEGIPIQAQAWIYKENQQTRVASVGVGETVELAPGTYRVELDVLGGRVTKTGVLIRSGRKRTLFMTEVALLSVNALDKKGEDLGFDVEIYDGVLGEKLGAFLTGETILVYPGVVDVKIATPPQSQWWRQVELRSGIHAKLEIRERVLGELLVRPLVEGRDVSTASEVVIYQPDTQKEVARSSAGREHRFSLESGPYDVYVTNLTGRGKPYVLEKAEVEGEKIVEKTVSLDQGPPG